MLIRFIKGCVLVVYLRCCANSVAGQNLTIPTETWREPVLNLSRESCASLAHNAALPFSTLDVAVAQPGFPEIQEVTSTYALLALQDYYSGNSTWRDMGTVNLPTNIQGPNGFFDGTHGKFYSDVVYWGLTFFYSFRTYNKSDLLDNAVESWNIVYSGAFIGVSTAASSSGAGRNVSFPPSSNCTGGTFAGGVFTREDVQNDTLVNMETVGPFMTLSAYLYEQTKNITYRQAAQLSLDFIINYMWNGTIALDTISLGSCEYVPKPFSFNQAWLVEGLSVWANVTGNDTLTTLLEMVVSNVTKFPSWSSPNGVVNDQDLLLIDGDPNQILKGIYIRGLAEAARRNPGTDLALFIEAYIYFNSLLDHARAPAPDDNYYSSSWIGPPTAVFDAGGSLAALDVLNAALSFAARAARSMPSGNTSSAGGPTPTSTFGSTPAKSLNAGALAGGVVGGVIAAVVAIAAVLLCRRRRIVNEVEEGDDLSGSNFVQPFISRPGHNPTVLSKSARLNSSYQEVAPPLRATLPVPVPDASRDQALDHNSTDVAELPSLVQFLMTFLQGRQGELPPRYHE
ncbi:hypothetical protein PENSPDRAFT_750421 [Peniophora sp. CONT]|nr:hypothetical protein PENSPDRAFT_750421 [Peniophora sp. CONT]